MAYRQAKAWESGKSLRVMLLLLVPWALGAFWLTVWLISTYWNDNKLMHIMMPHVLTLPVYFVLKPWIVHVVRGEIREFMASGN